MSNREEAGRGSKIFLDMKSIKKKVRKEGYRETQVQENKIAKKEKYPKQSISFVENDEDYQPHGVNYILDSLSNGFVDRHEEGFEIEDKVEDDFAIHGHYEY